MKETKFASLALNENIVGVTKKLHFKGPTEIQRKAIPQILSGKSLVAQSHTGSGKTHAYLLPIFNRIKSKGGDVQFVITAPTRELCQQIYGEVRKIIDLSGRENEWFAQLLIGGEEKQLRKAKKNLPQIIVGTPKRILSLINDGVLSIYKAESFVIDEADLMIDLGFIEEVDQLLVRSKKDIQVLAFSATIPERLQHFFQRYLRQPEYIVLNDQLFPDSLEHRLIALKHREPSQLIYELSKVFQPYLALIFTNGKKEADQLAMDLQGKGLNVAYLHGGLTPRERNRILREINNLRYQYIVATDLASRGIDIEGISHVINAQMPKEEHFYVHRVGRTARAGLAGLALSFYDEGDLPLIERLERKNTNFQYVDIKGQEWVKAKPLESKDQPRRKRSNPRKK